MRIMTCDQNAFLLSRLQRGIPVSAHPFTQLASECCTSEQYIFDLLESLRSDGTLRRFGAVYDARRLGFHSVLCAASVPPAELERYAAFASECSGVTHCYQRGVPDGANGYPNLWFTLAAPSAGFDRELSKLQAKFAPCTIHALPATKRFKIDVVFNLATRATDERTEPATPLTETGWKTDAPVFDITADEWKIVRAMQGDMKLHHEFFLPVAQELGMKHEALLEKIANWKTKGIIRRIGAVLRHNKIGFTANGMCCWMLPPERCEAAGRALAQCVEVTHCYERPPLPTFPFRLYAMIHANSQERAKSIFKRISEHAGLSAADGDILFSLREFKKTSLVF